MPEKLFPRKIIADEISLGRGMKIGDFLEQTDLSFNNNPF